MKTRKHIVVVVVLMVLFATVSSSFAKPQKHGRGGKAVVRVQVRLEIPGALIVDEVEGRVLLHRHVPDGLEEGGGIADVLDHEPDGDVDALARDVGEGEHHLLLSEPIERARDGGDETLLVDIDGKVYATGVASYYGKKFHGRKTASGEVYDMYAMTAAHRTLPFGTIVEVENKKNGRKILVKINDRGPFIPGRIIDLSKGAAQKLSMIVDGTAVVALRIKKWGE